MDTGLACLGDALEGSGFYLLNDCYATHLNKRDIETFLSILGTLDVKSRLWLKESPISANPNRMDLYQFSRRRTDYERESDYDIPGLEKICHGINESQSRLVWNFLISVSSPMSRRWRCCVRAFSSLLRV